MATHKPLPALPPPPLTTLSIDARAHRARLIRHLLSELPDPVIQARHEGWAFAIEEALDALSSSLAHNDWLAGIRRRRESNHRVKLDTALAERTPKPETKKLQDTAPKESRTQSPPPVIAPQPQIVDDVTTSRTRTQEVLHQLRAYVSRTNVPTTEQQGFHILLCLAPHGARVHFPGEDHGLSEIPANIGCAFVPSKFLLPPDVDQIETAVLYGMQEWNGQSLILYLFSLKLILPQTQLRTHHLSGSSAVHSPSKVSNLPPNTQL